MNNQNLIEALYVTMRKLQHTIAPDQYNAILIFTDVLIHELKHQDDPSHPSPSEPLHKHAD